MAVSNVTLTESELLKAEIKQRIHILNKERSVAAEETGIKAYKLYLNGELDPKKYESLFWRLRECDTELDRLNKELLKLETTSKSETNESPVSEKQLLNTENMVHDTVIACPKCGSYNPISESTCIVCGTELRQSPTIGCVCQNCGTAVVPEDAFCDICGVKLKNNNVR